MEKPIVLIVEDNPVEQKLLSLLLSRFGYECIVAPDGSQALEILEQMPEVELILMDWQMGSMDGLECTRRMRDVQARRGKRQPIIGVTARVLNGDRQQCLQAGMDDYLSKPFTPTDLQSTVARWTYGATSEGLRSAAF